MADTLDVPVLTEAEVIAKLASEFGIPESDVAVTFADSGNEEYTVPTMEIIVRDEEYHIPRTRAAMYKLIEENTRGAKKV